MKKLFIILCITLAACAANTNHLADNIVATPEEAKNAIWVYDYEKAVPVRNKQVNADTLTPAKLMAIINTDNIKLDFIKTNSDTIFVAIKDSKYLTEQIGSTGSYVFMSTCTYTLTELKGVKYVNYKFEKGDHAQPGTYSRKDFEKVQ